MIYAQKFDKERDGRREKSKKTQFKDFNHKIVKENVLCELNNHFYYQDTYIFQYIYNFFLFFLQ